MLPQPLPAASPSPSRPSSGPELPCFRSGVLASSPAPPPAEPSVAPTSEPPQSPRNVLSDLEFHEFPGLRLACGPQFEDPTVAEGPHRFTENVIQDSDPPAWVPTSCQLVLRLVLKAVLVQSEAC